MHVPDANSTEYEKTAYFFFVYFPEFLLCLCVFLYLPVFLCVGLVGKCILHQREASRLKDFDLC